MKKDDEYIVGERGGTYTLEVSKNGKKYIEDIFNETLPTSTT